jgi:hypothetical protein
VGAARLAAFRIVQEYSDADATVGDAMQDFAGHPVVRDYQARVSAWLAGPPAGSQQMDDLTSQELEGLFGRVPSPDDAV